MAMIQSRNISSHTYDEKTAELLFNTIINNYYPLFLELMKIEDEIDDLYLPYMVDLSQYEQLSNIDLIQHIDRVGVSIYEKSEI